MQVDFPAPKLLSCSVAQLLIGVLFNSEVAHPVAFLSPKAPLVAADTAGLCNKKGLKKDQSTGVGACVVAVKSLCVPLISALSDGF